MFMMRHLATSNLSYGTSFELACQSYLLHSHAISLSRRGGKNDRGIDLAGYLSSSSTSPMVRVHAQCKALNTPIAPAHIREFHGMLRNTRSRSLSDASSTTLLGLYCSASGYSRAALDLALLLDDDDSQVQEQQAPPVVLLDFVFLPDKHQVKRVGLWANRPARRLQGVSDLFASPNTERRKASAPET